LDETRGWQKAEINMVAAVKTKAEFDALFPDLSPLPKAASSYLT